MVFFFWKGASDANFFFFIWEGTGFVVSSIFSIKIVRWRLFCVMTHFCFGLVCKVVVNVQSSSILFTYTDEPHEENSKCKLLFWFSLQGGCGGPKELYSFHLPLLVIWTEP
jgi:hypothetical protein